MNRPPEPRPFEPPHFQPMESPFDLNVALPVLAGRFACLALIVVAAISGAPLLEWLSVPVLALTLIVVWGRHVLFIQNLHALPKLRAGDQEKNASGPLPRVSVITLVRNEETGVEPAVRSLAALEYPDLEILVIDDGSTDATPGILRRLAAELPRVRVLRAPDVPGGWTGKSHASWFAFCEADPAARWLLFTDARVMFHKSAVRRAVAHAEAKALTFLSCIFRFDCESLTEEWIAAIQSRGLVASARAFGGGPPPAPVGLGGFSLIRRDLYAASGGHSRFPANPIEDYMLSKLAKHCGGTLSVAIASELVSLRRYHGFADMRRRLVRTLRIGASDRVIYLANRIALEMLYYVLPLPVAAAGLLRLAAAHRFQPAVALVILLSLLTYLAGTCSPRSCRTVCRCGSRAVWLHPFGAALWVWFLLLAVVERLRGKPIRWRERIVQIPAPAVGTDRI